MTSRAFRIVGNLKMHLPRGILQEYGEAVDQRSLSLMVPHPYLSEAKKLCENTGITIGAQDVSAYQEGAHTGEVSANMLQDLGVTEVLVGHSETRHRGEDVTLQLDSCRQSGLSVKSILILAFLLSIVTSTSAFIPSGTPGKGSCVDEFLIVPDGSFLIAAIIFSSE